MKGLFIPGITVEMFRNGNLEQIEALMSEGEIYDIEYEPKWIPTSERLPEEDGHYIVAVKNGLFPNNVIPIDILRYEGGKWKYYFVLENDGFEDDDFEDPIMAWMPLPDLYEVKNE